MMTNRAQTAVFYVLLAFAVAVAIFPHVPAELYRYRLNSVFVAFTCAFAWLLCFLIALWLRQWRVRQCIVFLVAGAFACGPAALVLATWAVWSLYGFAP
jgi:hypothetical protein